MFRTPLLIAALALSAVAGVAAQDPLARALEGLDLREIGPAVMGGRVSDFAVVESRPSSYYVGMASGGVWFTDSDGASWTPLFDDQPCSSIGAMAVHPADPGFVWVGTGEPQNRQSSPYGCGVFRSRDGGRTWEDLGLSESRHVGRIALHPTDPERAWVAAVGDLFAPGGERGVFRTTDGGATWERVLFVDEHTGAVDLVMHPTNPQILFAAMYQRRRTSFGFSGGGPGSGLYRSRDGGDTWERLAAGLPEGDLGRIGLDVYRGDGNLVYATVEAGGTRGGVFRTTDGGDHWERVSLQNPRPSYFSLIRIDPSNPERIYLGGTSLQASDDGGRTWWDADGADLVHVDHHALWIDPADSGHLIDGNDGGVASSWDGARTWRIHNNFATGQFYEVGVDMSEPYRVCGGLQDSDAWCGPNRSTTVFGTRNRDWLHLLEGDGFHAEFSPGVTGFVYVETQNGNVRRLRLDTREVQSIRPVARPTEVDEDRAYRFNWNAPLAPSLHDTVTVYLGGNHLMRSRDRGLSWEEASPDLTRAIDRDTLPIMGRVVDESTLSPHDGVSSYGTITAFAESPLAPELLWVGTDDGNLQVSRDGGATWENVVGRIRGLPERSPVSRIEASHAAEGRVYVAFDRHLDGDYRAYVYVSEDYGRSWNRITEGLPDWSVNVVREHPATPDLLFVGNEVGVFVSVDRGASWARMSGLPTVPVDDLVVHPRDNDLVVGTHGRSIWILDDLAVLQELAASSTLDRAVHLFPSGAATQWFLHQDWPFWGEAYEGEDPPNGALIRYWLLEDAPEAPILRIVGPRGDTVRELRGPSDAGLQHVVWDMREALPAEVVPEDAEEDDEAGALVLPGSYRVVLSSGDTTLERELTVRMDPRAEADLGVLTTRQAIARSAAVIDATRRAAQDALGRVSDQVREALQLLEETEADSALVAEASALSEELDSLRTSLADALPGRILGAIESTSEAPTADVQWQIDRAWARVPELIDDLNAIITDRIPAFHRRLDEAGVRPDPGAAVRVPTRPPEG